MLQESNLILAKLNYVEGDYKEALNIYARVGLEDLPLVAVPPYRLRLMAEAYATKGESCAVCPWGAAPGRAVRIPQSLPGGCRVTPCPWLAMDPDSPQQGPPGWAPTLSWDHLKPNPTWFLQSLRSLVIPGGSEGKTFQESFLIINMQPKQGLFLAFEMRQNICRDSFYVAVWPRGRPHFYSLLPPLCSWRAKWMSATT